MKTIVLEGSTSDSFTIFGLWVLGLAVSNINESQLQTYESKTLFLMTSLQNYCIPGLAEIKTYAQKMQDAQVTKSLVYSSLLSKMSRKLITQIWQTYFRVKLKYQDAVFNKKKMN